MGSRLPKRLILFIGVLLFAVILPVFGGVELVFVAPEGGSTNDSPASLRDSKVLQVRGGRAFAFRELSPGENARADAIKEYLSKSKAVRRALDLWGQARNIAPAPCQKWIAGNSRVPVWVLPNSSQGKGLGIISLVPVRVTSSGSSFDASQIIVASDLKTPNAGQISLEEMMIANILIPMMCHEIFHGIQSDLFRERFLLLEDSSMGFGVPHDSPLETDPRTAFKEGFAEGGELWLASFFPQEFYIPQKAIPLKPAVSSFVQALNKRRLVLAGRNRYIFEADGRIRNGRLNSGSSDLATEGVIASLIFTLFGHVGWVDPSRAVFNCMAHSAPMNFFDFVNRLLKENPAKASTIRRIILEYTRYTIFSSDALSKYEAYYLSRKAFLQGKLSRDDYKKVHSMWQDWKAAQLKRIESGAPLTGAVPQPFIVATRQGYTLDLHDEDFERLAWHLEAFIPPGNPQETTRLAASFAQKIVSHRKELGVFESVRDLEGVVPKWLCKKFQTGFLRFLMNEEKKLNKKISDRRGLNGY